jgi:hypothetical protein
LDLDVITRILNSGYATADRLAEFRERIGVTELEEGSERRFGREYHSMGNV